jgi:hypothetical protein
MPFSEKFGSVHQDPAAINYSRFLFFSEDAFKLIESVSGPNDAFDKWRQRWI